MPPKPPRADPAGRQRRRLALQRRALPTTRRMHPCRCGSKSSWWARFEPCRQAQVRTWQITCHHHINENLPRCVLSESAHRRSDPAPRPHPERRFENVALLAFASETIQVSSEIRVRARQFQAAGFGPFDALHLACAEAARVDVLLTTDDGFMRKASRGDGRPRVAVRNPLSWSRENLP